MKQVLLQKINDHRIVAGVVGLGYVGLPLAVAIARAGFKTIGFDMQQQKVDKVNRGESYVGDVTDAALSVLTSTGQLTATHDFSFIEQVDFVAICVPTPLDGHQQPDLSYVKSSTESIARHLHRQMMVVLESTTYPGTTEELLKPILESSGLQCGTDFYLGFSPERVDPGNSRYHTANTPKVIGACTPEGCEVIAAMYEAALHTTIHRVSSPAIAEMSKILENTYRNVNIGLINELAILCHHMHINLWEVIEAAKTKPFGFQPFYPGPGLGGHCIPLDPYYLSWKAREYGFHTSMIESSMMVNDRMPEYCVERVGQMLSRRLSKSLNGAQLLVLGIAYKADVSDYRESPALDIIELLHRSGATLRYYDPYIPSFTWKGVSYRSEEQLTADLLAQADAVIITTGHHCIDYSLVQQQAKAIFDCRNAMAAITPRENIELL